MITAGNIYPDARTQIRAVEDVADATVERLHLAAHEDLLNDHPGHSTQCVDRDGCPLFERSCRKVKSALALLGR